VTPEAAIMKEGWTVEIVALILGCWFVRVLFPDEWLFFWLFLLVGAFFTVYRVMYMS
jgi:hypothetical protein